MDIEKFGLGIRFDLDKTDTSADEGESAAEKFILTKFFENLITEDVEGLNLYTGEYKLNPAEKDGIFTIALTEGGHKCMKSLYNKISSDTQLSEYLTSYLPFVQTNVLRNAETLAYCGRFDENGILKGENSEPVFIPKMKTKTKTKKKRHQNKKQTSDNVSDIKIVLAPDKFKGSMTAETAADILCAAAKEIIPDATVVKLPMADGGEGTLNTLVCACGGIKHTADVTGPTGRKKVTAEYGFVYGGTAIIDMAEASGLMLLNEDERNPLETTSRGTGELIIRALDEGAERIIIGIGGSATNDAGMGAATALGAKFLDSDGNALAGWGADMQKVSKTDLSALDKRLFDTDIIVMCDVDNPLTGPNGATFVYAPQKGADAEMLPMLETGMKNIERLYNSIAGEEVCSLKGCGAAGGMGAMLKTLANARLIPGAEAVLETLDFIKEIKNADLVVTGEGMFDRTSAENEKAVGTVIRFAEKENIPAAVIAGCLSEEYKNISEIRENIKLFAVYDRQPAWEELEKDAEARLFEAAKEMFREFSNEKNRMEPSK